MGQLLLCCVSEWKIRKLHNMVGNIKENPLDVREAKIRRALSL